MPIGFRDGNPVTLSAGGDPEERNVTALSREPQKKPFQRQKPSPQRLSQP